MIATRTRVRSRKAFTLIELIVCTGIVALLTAIALPVFQTVRKNSYNATCHSNLRQLGMAISMYALDYGDVYPAAVDGLEKRINHPEPLRQWIADAADINTALLPYTKNPRLFFCPADRNLPTSPGQKPTYYEEMNSSYSYDYCPSYSRSGIAYFDNPSNSYLMADMSFYHQGTNWRDGRLNQLFADGHVKNLSWVEHIEYLERQRCDN